MSIQVGPRVGRAIASGARSLVGAGLLSCALFAASVAEARPAATRIDLRSDQTPIVNQGGRNTCVTFGAIAGLEAAYRRASYPVDLSEEFTNFMGKTLWLHWPYNERGPDGAESQVGAFGGGGGVGYVIFLTSGGLRVPENTIWPYSIGGYPAATYPALSNSWTSDFWRRSQRNTSSFNFDPRHFTTARLTASRYYSGQSANVILRGAGPRGDALVEAIETELAARREVVIDARLEWRREEPSGRETRLMRACAAGSSGCGAGGHSMLVVGYDRRDPRNPYFILKNSWGSEHSSTRSDGFTYVSYDFIRDKVYEAASFTGVRPPGPWPELATLGRWDINFDGWRAQLDIYHLPGTAQWYLDSRGVRDRRVGRLYMPDGTAFSVNGQVTGNRLTLHLPGAEQPLQPFDSTAGRRFDYILSVDRDVMAGTHRDGDGSVYGGFAVRRGSAFNAYSSIPQRNGFTAASLVGRWELRTGDFRRPPTVIRITRVSGAMITATRDGGGAVTVSFAGPAGEARQVVFGNLPAPGQIVSLMRMSWQGDMASGHVRDSRGVLLGPAVMRQVSPTP